jgi:hypothetical protein
MGYFLVLLPSKDPAAGGYKYASLLHIEGFRHG